MKAIKWALTGVAASALMAAALPVQAGSHGDKTLTVALETDLRGFEAIKAAVLGVSASAVMNTTTERLMEWDGDGGMLPQLATKYEMAADRKSITYTLRKGVKYSNGDDFSARHVAHHYTRLLDPKNRYFGRLFISSIQKVVADGDHTVTFQLAHPWIPAETMHGAFSFTSFIPNANHVDADKQMRDPLGTGAFILTEWRAGDRIILDRNPNYWNADAVKLDRVIFRFMPDQATRYAALQSGEVDMIWTDRGDTVRKAEKNDKVTVFSRKGAGAGIGFMNNAKEPFNNLNARRAFMHSWNQAAYVKVSIKDIVDVVDHPLGPDVQCDAGYRGPDGAMAKKFAAAYEAETGKKLEHELIHTSTQRGREFGEIIQQLTRRNGITSNLQPVDQLQLRQRVFTNNYNISGWRIADTGDVGPQLFALLHSKSPYNLTKYNNPKMDGLVIKMRTALTPEAREAATCDVVKLMNDEAPIFLTNGRTHYTIANKNVVGDPVLFQGVPDVRYMDLK